MSPMATSLMTPLRRAREYARHLAVRSFFEGSSKAFSFHPSANPARHAVERISNISYLSAEESHARGADPELHLLDVWRPLEAGATKKSTKNRAHHGAPWPIVFYVHGGAFSILSKDTHWIMALAYARRGFLVFNVNYRLAPTHRYPAAIADVCDAWAWMTKNAAAYGGDLSRVVVAGESAGANLVTSLSICTSYARPEPHAKLAFDTGVTPLAAVPACGLFQVSDIMRLARRKPSMSNFVRDILPNVSAPYIGDESRLDLPIDLADPLLFFERGKKPERPLPPFFLPVGTKDILLDDTRRLGVALRNLGVTAEEKYYPGEVHAFHAFVMRKAARQCWADTYAFLDRHVPTRAESSAASGRSRADANGHRSP